MRRILSGLQQQRGQAMVMFIGIFTVIAVVGVIVVDFGLWFSERRGAQTDADLPALAGARECMLELITKVDHDPTWAIEQWFDENNGGNAELVADKTSTDCEPQDNGELCVDVVVRHKSKTLFSSFFSPVFDGVAGNIGAHARACAGAAAAPENVVPFEVAKPDPCFSGGSPDFDNLCPLESGAHGECPPDAPSSCKSNPRGMADLEAPPGYCSEGTGNADPGPLIACGAPGMCLPNEGDACPASPWYDCAAVQDGNTAEVLDAIQCRLNGGSYCNKVHKLTCTPEGEGLCDTDANGIDDFDESVTLMPGTDNVYEPKDCDPTTAGEQISPRIITVIVFDEIPPPGGSSTGRPIRAFAGFYLAGCAEEGKIVNTTDDLTEDERKCIYSGPPGNGVVYGQWVNLICAGCGIGPVDESTTVFGIALVDWEGGGGGAPGPTPTPTPAPTATRTPVPPPTATPTNTPLPTATRTPVPTATATPCPCGMDGNSGKCKKNCP